MSRHWWWLGRAVVGGDRGRQRAVRHCDHILNFSFTARVADCACHYKAHLVHAPPAMLKRRRTPVLAIPLSRHFAQNTTSAGERVIAIII